MTMNGRWQELYKTALLELRPQELRQRIDYAEKAIQQRIAELRRDDSSFHEESQALDDAPRGLRVLTDTECKPPRSAGPGLAEQEATS
jgi:hypothetical protein